MDAYWIITAFVVIDTLMERLGHRSDVRAQVPDSEILTIAVVAAKYFGNHHRYQRISQKRRSRDRLHIWCISDRRLQLPCNGAATQEILDITPVLTVH